jgi:hypothetical protein
MIANKETHPFLFPPIIGEAVDLTASKDVRAESSGMAFMETEIRRTSR